MRSCKTVKARLPNKSTIQPGIGFSQPCKSQIVQTGKHQKQGDILKKFMPLLLPLPRTRSRPAAFPLSMLSRARSHVFMCRWYCHAFSCDLVTFVQVNSLDLLLGPLSVLSQKQNVHNLHAMQNSNAYTKKHPQVPPGDGTAEAMMNLAGALA